ncbi:hypothetical protein J132_07153 [Termitomyces sp. J132]|nr:hypothetical protein J132_07153 [Termitomyces sp. J132]
MYLCNALDKGNVGNAKTDGWDKVLVLYTLSENETVIISRILVLPGTSFGTPISLLVKHFSAARVLPLMMIGFVRPLVSGLSFCFDIYSAASIAGAFSGLIAFGVFHIEVIKYKSWQFLFWIEGGATICLAVICFFWLPRSPSTWWILSDREKTIARARVLSDSSVKVDERLNIQDAFRPFLDPMYWLWAMISVSFGVPLASVNNFLPQIVASLGYSTVKTNLFTVAPNIVGTVALLILTFSSDYFRERSIHICIPLITAVVGFIILGSIDVVEYKRTAYFACFLLTMGAFAPSVLVSAWQVNFFCNHFMVGSFALANSSGLISTNVFRARDEPQYIPAAFGGFCFILVASVGVYMRLENRRRNKEQGVKITAADVDTEDLGQGSTSPAFRYMY